VADKEDKAPVSGSHTRRGEGKALTEPKWKSNEDVLAAFRPPFDAQCHGSSPSRIRQR